MIYLDNAATSFPKPEKVYDRIDEVLREISGNPGRASHRMALEAGRVIFGARESVTRLINAGDSSRVSFTKNATEAVNIGIKGSVVPGDHIVTTSFEHNSVAKTVGAIEAAGIEVTRVRPDRLGFVSVKDISGAIRKNTRLVCLSHASNVFGTIQDIEAIGKACRARSVRFMVDGAQTVGAMPIDVIAMNIDILAATGHKALFGPQGTGFIYTAKGIELEPLIHGGTGELDTLLEMPERLENGTMNTPGVGGLGAGVEFLFSEGVDKIRAYEEGLIGEIIRGLSAIEKVKIIGTLEASSRAALVAFNIEGRRPAEVGRILDEEFECLVRTGVHCAPDAHREAGTHPDGGVRVSPGYFTREPEIESFLKAIRTIAAR